MISSNTRASRSRFSSPANPQSSSWSGTLDASRVPATDTRTFMQKWLEPTVQAKTSFEEDGLVRYGVVENMAPLGTLPKSKKTASGENVNPVRRIILKTSGGNAQAKVDVEDKARILSEAADESADKEAWPLPSPTVASSRKTQRKTTANATAKDEDEDAEYDPKGDGTRRRQSGRVSLTRKARRSSGARRASVSSSTATKRRAASSEPPKPPVEPADKEFVDKVVETAVDEALKHYRYPTAWALRTLYDTKSGDTEFVTMIEDVFSQTASADTMDEFSRQMEEKKREGKKDNQGCYYFVPPSTNSRFTPHKAKPGPYADLLQHDEEGEEEEETRATKKIKTSHGDDDAAAPSEAILADGTGTPSRKRARRHSASSNSSLSSVMSISSPEISSKPAANRAGKAPAAIAGQTRSAKSSDAPKPRPITTRGKSKQAVSNTSESVSPTHPNRTLTNTITTNTTKASKSVAGNGTTSSAISSATSSASPSSSKLAEAGMPGRLSTPSLISSLPVKSSKSNKDIAAKSHMVDEDDAALWERRREAQKVTNGYTVRESSVRGRGRGRDDDDEDEDPNATPARKSRRTRHSMLPSVATRATRSVSRKPAADDGESVASSVVESPKQNEASSTVASRAVTPTSLRPPKKPKTGLRVKSSPVKKKGGTAAGVPRSVGEGNSASTGGASRDQAADNDEYCSACGNNGDVVCCDGCPRSFHFECVDMVQSETLPDEWYCNECLFKKFPSRVPVYKGVFASALNNLEKTIPRAFSLPKKLQTRFEGVRAGADGDYEEIANSRAAKRKSGYEELPDFFRQREDGQAVLCHSCQKPATEIRAIIPCSICPLYWHIDCLDPPLAVPPVLKTWRCPAHIDDVLIEVPSLAPAHRFRKLKGSQIITPALPRGNKNNGHIEVDWSDEPEERNDAGWPDPQSFGRTFKLPAQSIVLDFIEQLRRKGAGHGPKREEPSANLYSVPPITAPIAQPSVTQPYNDRTVEDMQLSLNLIGLRQSRSEGVDQLQSALLNAADDNVLALMAKANADNFSPEKITDNDKLGLRTMLAQMEAMSSKIRHLLGEDLPPSSPPDMIIQGTTPISEPPGDIETPEKIERLAPVTEPTPPSTFDQAETSMDLD